MSIKEKRTTFNDFEIGDVTHGTKENKERNGSKKMTGNMKKDGTRRRLKKKTREDARKERRRRRHRRW